MQARAIQAEQEALAHEAARVGGAEGGRLRLTERDRKACRRKREQGRRAHGDASEDAARDAGSERLRSARAVRGRDRDADVRILAPSRIPGIAVATLVDRTTVRSWPRYRRRTSTSSPLRRRCTSWRLRTNRELHGTIARRSPSADLSTRTSPPRDRRSRSAAATLPVGTTAEIAMDVGEPVAATEIPLVAASVRGSKATVFVVDGDVAKKGVYQLKGERGGSLFLDSVAATGQPRRDGRTRPAQGRRPRRCAARAVSRGRPSKLAGIKPVTRLSLKNPIAILMVCIGARGVRGAW